MSWTHITLIAPESVVQIARDTCAAAHPAGAGMLTSGLSADGSLPATHYISSGMVEPQWLPMLSDPVLAHQAAVYGAQQQGIAYTHTAEDVAAAFALIDVSQEPWQEAVARLGLQPAQSDA